MSYSIDENNKITLTRGDTLIARIKIITSEGDPYEPSENDTVRFAMKASVKDEEPLLIKDIPVSTMELRIESEDTKKLPFGKYVYDVELAKETGEVDTFITKSPLVLTEEVH